MSLVGHLDIGRSDRVAIDRGGTLRDAEKRPTDIVVDNLSRTGCLFVLDADLPLGALVSIGIAGIGIRYARLSRAARPHYACAFLAPVSDAEIVAALSADTLVAGAFPRAGEPAAAAPAIVPTIVPVFAEEEAAEEPALPVGARIAIIVGASAALWALLIALMMLARP